MKVVCSEFVYTSWKNGGVNSGFSAFSISPDVTKGEADEIVEKMAYVKPVNLPNKPTEAEIQELFPKNNAYFRLQSGRYCLAQATYVGKDYAVDINPRWANFIIHAYLFEQNDEISPPLFAETDCFKIELSAEEREYKKPLSPKSVDLETEVSTNQAFDALNSIVTSGEASQFFCFLQSILNRIERDGAVIVSHGNQKKVLTWLKAMALLLPQKYLMQVTYGTYLLFKNQDFKINFLYDANSISPREELRSCPQNAVLLYDDASISETPALCRYLKDLQSILATPDRMYRYKKNIDTVFKTDVDLSLDRAVKIYHYMRKNTAYFTDKEDFIELTKYILRTKRLKGASEAALYMIKNCCFDEQTKNSLCFIGDIYTRLDPAEQDAVRSDFFSQCFQNATSGAEFMSLCMSNPTIVGESIPYTHAFFIGFVANNDAAIPKLEKIVLDIGKRRFDLFDADLKLFYLDSMVDYFYQLIEKRNYEEAAQVLRVMEERSAVEDPTLIPILVHELVDSQSDCFSRLDFCFEMLDLLSSYRDLYWKILGYAYETVKHSYEDRKDFLVKYLRRYAENDAQIRDIDIYSSCIDIESFITYLDFISFITTSMPGINELGQAYNKYVGKDGVLEHDEEATEDFYGLLSARAKALFKVTRAMGDKNKKGREAVAIDFAFFDNFLPWINKDKVTDRFMDWFYQTAIHPFGVQEILENKKESGNFFAVKRWPSYQNNKEHYPKLTLLIDAWQIYERKFVGLSYVEENVIAENLFASEEAYRSYIHFILQGLLHDDTVSFEQSMLCLSPFFRSSEVLQQSLNLFFATESNVKNARLLFWLITRYNELQIKEEKDAFEKSFLFPLLTDFRKPILTMAKDKSREMEETLSLLRQYLDGISFNMFNKPVRKSK